MKRESLKDPARERRQFVWRAGLAGVLVAAAFAGLLGRLIYLQVFEHPRYAALAQENRVRVVALPPPRGLIYDRHGVVLAENVPSYSLEITPEQVPDLDAALTGLAQVVALTPEDLRRFRAQVRAGWPFKSIVLKPNLTPQEVARFAVERYRFPGVDVVPRLRRYYPLGPALAPVVGYVGRIDVAELRTVDAANYEGTSQFGKVGIERFYEARLHGRAGYQRIEVNAKGRPLRVLATQPPVPGQDLVLSVDAGLQQVTARALAGKEGAAVAIDPRTGEVLALVSSPAYDPNWFVDGISRARYDALRKDANLPLFNRALAGQYPPASTIKPFMALAGMQYGVIEPEQKLYAGPFWRIPGDPARRKYLDWNRGGHGPTDVVKAIAESADTYFYQLAFRLGIRKMDAFLSRFGFGQPTGIDTTGARAGLLPTPEWKRRTQGVVWYPGNTVVAGIGQGFMLATPLQLASATATLSLSGQRFRPHFLRAQRDPVNGEMLASEPYPLPPVEVGSARYWEAVHRGMWEVTHRKNGTAWLAFKDFPYSVAGKTGTAQVSSFYYSDTTDESTIPYKLRDNGLFIAYAPADQPLIAVAVVVEHGGGGSHSAAPVAHDMIRYYLDHNTRRVDGRLQLLADPPAALVLQPAAPPGARAAGARGRADAAS